MRRIAYVFVFCLAAMCAQGGVVKSIMGGMHARHASAGNVGPYDSRVEYLASSGGGEYIDTGIYHYKTNDIHIKVWTYGAYPTRHSERFFGATNGLYATMFQRYAQSKNFFYTGILLYGQIACRDLPTNVTYEVTVHSEDTGRSPGTEYATINGIQYSNGYGWNMPQVSASTVILFPNVARNNRIYYFRIDNQISLVPVRIGRIGYMYDEMTGILYGNCAGKGAFIVGPDVPEPQEETP